MIYKKLCRAIVILLVICLLFGVFECSAVLNTEKIQLSKSNATEKLKNITIITKNTTINPTINLKNVTKPTIKINQTTKLNTTKSGSQSNATKILNLTPPTTSPALKYPPITLTPPGWETFDGLAKGCTSSCVAGSDLLRR